MDEFNKELENLLLALKDLNASLEVTRDVLENVVKKVKVINDANAMTIHND